MSAGKLLAYLDRWSFRPGDTVVCRVSCEGATHFDAELVRVVQGDTHPDSPGYREEPVALSLGGPFEARFQPIRTGSMALVEDSPLFAALDSFGIAARIWPTTPGRRAQTLLARRDPVTGFGFELGIDARGALVVDVVSAAGSARASTGAALQAHRWYAIRASYDARAGKLSLSQSPKVHHARVGDRARVAADAPRGLAQHAVTAPLTLAARAHDEHAERRHYNGRIDGVRLFAAPLPLDGALPATPLAAWQFGIDIPTQRVTDVSGNQLHGRLLNLPARGVTGYDWDGSALHWGDAPAHYAAIHFHDDDLYDAGWAESLRFNLPRRLASGVYAVRLHTPRDEFYLPFCVRPPAGRRGAEAVLLMPTASYMAYANNRIGLDVPETELVCGRLLELTPEDLYMQEHPELGLSFYDVHNDGSAVYYSSRLRPVMDFQPGFTGKLGGAGSNVWQFNADTHVLGWLEHTGTRFDVVTDEDLHREGADSLAGYRVLLTGTHPEYYSAAMRDALDTYTAGGGRLMYLGGNGFYWRISFSPDLPGVIECRKSEDGIRAAAPGPGEYHASLSGEYTGLWRRNGRPPNELAGVGMVAQGFDIASPYQRNEASHDPRVAFMFEGIDGEIIGDFGLSGGGAAGIEVDAANLELGTPAHALVVASSHIHTDLYLMTPEDMLDPAPGLGGTEAESIRADLVFFETANGGAVFSTGSIAWAGAMAWNRYDNPVARLTGNVLRRFLDPDGF